MLEDEPEQNYKTPRTESILLELVDDPAQDIAKVNGAHLKPHHTPPLSQVVVWGTIIAFISHQLIKVSGVLYISCTR